MRRAVEYFGHAPGEGEFDVHLNVRSEDSVATISRTEDEFVLIGL